MDKTLEFLTRMFSNFFNALQNIEIFGVSLWSIIVFFVAIGIVGILINALLNNKKEVK